MSDVIGVHRNARVVTVTIDRPDVLNALDQRILDDLLAVLGPLDDDPTVGCFVVTGSERAFAAGADISDMRDRRHDDLHRQNYLAGWDGFVELRTPKIAAVSGYALGGGCELAMMCDTIYASETARFGQPEVKLGLIPGMGGSQRLTRAVGKATAMDMILTGRMIDAAEAKAAGLVGRVLPADGFLDAVADIASQIADFEKMTTMLAREVVDHALEGPLHAGLRHERSAYHSIFATPGAREGVAAFLDKRTPQFNQTVGGEPDPCC